MKLPLLLQVPVVFALVRPPVNQLQQDTNLEDLNVWRPIRTVAAAVPLYVFEPLNVRLGITVYLTVELDVTAHHCCSVGG